MIDHFVDDISCLQYTVQILGIIGETGIIQKVKKKSESLEKWEISEKIGILIGKIGNSRILDVYGRL